MPPVLGHVTWLQLMDRGRCLLCCLQLALDEAQELMDIAAAGEGSSFDAIRQPLAEAYQKAGLVDVANFIKAA